jgi:hypothetical protein
MHRNLASASLDQLRETLINIRMFDLQKGSFHKSKTAAFSNTSRCFSHVFVCFLATAAVPHYKHTAFDFVSHANATASSATAGAQ